MTTSKTGRRIICPACRALGSGEDCVDRIKHAPRVQAGNLMSRTEFDAPDYVDFQVVLTLPVSVEIIDQPLRAEADELYTQLTEDPEQLIELLRNADGDYDIRVNTPAEHG